MFRINLYPEYVEQRKEARIRIVKTGALSAMGGLLLLSLGSLVLSAFLVQTRVAGLSEVVDGQMTQIESQSAMLQELVCAREMLNLRGSRIDWAPKLAMLSEKINYDLYLINFEGNRERGNVARKLLLAGESRDEGVQMQVFTRFVDTLREDPRISADFPNLKLGSVGGGQGNQFKIMGDNEEEGK